MARNSGTQGILPIPHPTITRWPTSRRCRCRQKAAIITSIRSSTMSGIQEGLSAISPNHGRLRRFPGTGADGTQKSISSSHMKFRHHNQFPRSDGVEGNLCSRRIFPLSSASGSAVRTMLETNLRRFEEKTLAKGRQEGEQQKAREVAKKLKEKRGRSCNNC